MYTPPFTLYRVLTLSQLQQYRTDLSSFKSILLQMTHIQFIKVWTEPPQPYVQVQDESGQTVDHGTYLRRLNELLKASRQDILTKCPMVENFNLKFYLNQSNPDTQSTSISYILDID